MLDKKYSNTNQNDDCSFHEYDQTNYDTEVQYVRDNFVNNKPNSYKITPEIPIILE